MTEQLTYGDLQSVSAGKLRRHVENKLQSLRVKNDSDLDPTATAALRGELKAYKDLRNLLALAKPDPATGADEEQAE